MRRRWIIALIILFLIALLFQFDPFHPIQWWQRTVAQFHQGLEDGKRDQANHKFRIHHIPASPSDTQQHSAAPSR